MQYILDMTILLMSLLYKVVDARDVWILVRAHVMNLQEGLNIRFFVMKTNNNERPVLGFRQVSRYVHAELCQVLIVGQDKSKTLPHTFHVSSSLITLIVSST